MISPPPPRSITPASHKYANSCLLEVKACQVIGVGEPRIRRSPQVEASTGRNIDEGACRILNDLHPGVMLMARED